MNLVTANEIKLVFSFSVNLKTYNFFTSLARSNFCSVAVGVYLVAYVSAVDVLAKGL